MVICQGTEGAGLKLKVCVEDVLRLWGRVEGIG